MALNHLFRICEIKEVALTAWPEGQSHWNTIRRSLKNSESQKCPDGKHRTPGSLVSISCIDTWTVMLTSSVPGGYYPPMGTLYEWGKSDYIVWALMQGDPKAHSLLILRSAWISFWLCVLRPKLITYQLTPKIKAYFHTDYRVWKWHHSMIIQSVWDLQFNAQHTALG